MILIRKSQLPDGTYVPASKLRPDQREKVRVFQERLRAFGVSSKKHWRDKAAADPVRRALENNTEAIKNPMVTRKGGRKVSSEFNAGWKQRTGKNPPLRMRSHGESLGNIGGGGAPAAFVGGTKASRPVVSVHEGLPVLSEHDQRFTGVHESAHYATDSQVRRGKSRSPYRLVQIGLDPKKLAREEGRADGTAVRHGLRESPVLDSYANGTHFNQSQQREYNKVRRNMGAPNKYDTEIPRGKRPYRGFKLPNGARVLGAAKKYPTTVGTTAVALTGVGAYYAAKKKKNKQPPLKNIKKSQYYVRERRVSGLERAHDRQKRFWTGAGKVGGSLVSGDVSPDTLSAALDFRRKGMHRKAYAANSKNPHHLWDKVSHVETYDPKAKLQVRRKTKWQKRGERAGSAAGTAAGIAGAGALYTGRKNLGKIGAHELYNTFQNPRSIPKIFVPRGRSAAVIGGAAAVGAGLAAMRRPVNVKISYSRNRGSNR